jgi:ribose transport system permease protein
MMLTLKKNVVQEQPRHWSGRSWAVPVALLCFYIVFGGAFVRPFVSVENLISIMFSCAITIPVVMGMQALLILGYFDLSVGAAASLITMIFGIAVLRFDSIAFGALLAICSAVGIGMINGLLVSMVMINPLISTLAMMGILRSLSLGINDGRIVSGLPLALSTMTNSRIAFLPAIVLIGFGLVVVLELCFRFAVRFRRFYAAGGNPVAANNAGIRVTSLVIAGYIGVTIGAATTGLIQASRTLSASPLLFDDLALEAIAACILGGGTLKGGQGTMVGALLGLIVVTSTRNMVVLLDVPVYWKDLAIGLLLLVLTSFDFIMSRATTFMTNLSAPSRGEEK